MLTKEFNLKLTKLYEQNNCKASSPIPDNFTCMRAIGNVGGGALSNNIFLISLSGFYVYMLFINNSFDFHKQITVAAFTLCVQVYLTRKHHFFMFKNV